jgi:DNA-binding CsgD family transcriptional regulator
VELVKNHPVLALRYGETVHRLADAWRRLLRYEAKVAHVFIGGDGPDAAICCCGVSVFVNDDFVSEIKQQPHVWIGPELTRRMTGGISPVLTDRQLRDLNSDHGLNLVCWEAAMAAGYESSADLQRFVMATFIHEHQGYRWREAISTPALNRQHLQFILRSGGCLWDSAKRHYRRGLIGNADAIVKKPHVIGITRELETQRQADWAGTWVGTLFEYRRPLLGFSRAEQRLLLSALCGATDERLAATLDVSLPAVKKHWLSIYRRVEAHVPALIEPHANRDGSSTSRGKEKRRGVLTYVRDHPEELRPVSRKLLAAAPAL